MRNVPLLISPLDLSIAPTTVILLHQALLYHVTGWSPGDGTATEWLHTVDGRGRGGNSKGMPTEMVVYVFRQVDSSLKGVPVTCFQRKIIVKNLKIR